MKIIVFMIASLVGCDTWISEENDFVSIEGSAGFCLIDTNLFCTEWGAGWFGFFPPLMLVHCDQNGCVRVK